MSDQSLAPHGTRRRYGHRSAQCHCDDCRAANTRYQRAYRARTQAQAPPGGWRQLELWRGR